MLTFNIEFIVYTWIGEHVWYIGINMFIFSSLIHTVKELRYVWMSFLSTCVLCVELRHMCKMFYTCMHLYFELHACTFLLKMKKSQTILCWFNCYYFREMALEIPRIPHKKYGKNNAKICRDEYERVFWIHTCFKYHSCVCHTWVFTKGDNVSQLVS